MGLGFTKTRGTQELPQYHRLSLSSSVSDGVWADAAAGLGEGEDSPGFLWILSWIISLSLSLCEIIFYTSPKMQGISEVISRLWYWFHVMVITGFVILLSS
jgi:hypothetical protein